MTNNSHITIHHFYFCSFFSQMELSKSDHSYTKIHLPLGRHYNGLKQCVRKPQSFVACVHIGQLLELSLIVISQPCHNYKLFINHKGELTNI